MQPRLRAGRRRTVGPHLSTGLPLAHIPGDAASYEDRANPMLSKLFPFRRHFRPTPPEPSGPQYGALPYTILEGQLVVLLITSRGRGKWIFPKGGLIEGMTPWESAAHEAYEEAGVEGEIEHEPIGRYFLPVTEERPKPVEVEIFPLRVARQREDWKEQGSRYRHWAVLAEAKRLITHEGLADVAVALAQRELGSGKAQEEKTVTITE